MTTAVVRASHCDGRYLHHHKHGERIVRIWDKRNRRGTLVELNEAVTTKIASPSIDVEAGNEGVVFHILDNSKLSAEEKRNGTDFDLHVVGVRFEGKGEMWFRVWDLTPVRHK
jgi:hypothetical protein